MRNDATSVAIIEIGSDRVCGERLFSAISRQRTRLAPSSAAAFPPVVIEDGDGADRMNASAESTGMGFYKGPTAVGGARQPDATNQFANRGGLLQLRQHLRFRELRCDAIQR